MVWVDRRWGLLVLGGSLVVGACRGPNPKFGTTTSTTDGPGSSSSTTVTDTSGSTAPTGTESSSSATNTNTTTNTTTTITTTAGTETTDGSGSISSSGPVMTSTGDTEGLDVCPPYAVDACAEDQKCVPVDYGPNGLFDTYACVPVLGEEPHGAPCEVFEPGEDDCENGSFCLFDRCTDLCVGNPDDPLCEFPGTVCVTLQIGIPMDVCLHTCDPLNIDTCVEGHVCVPTPMQDPPGFVCVLDVSEGGGKQGDPCQFVNQCSPVHLCVDANAIEGCLDIACCTSMCSLDPNNPGMCPMPLECVPFYEDMPPPGYEFAGVCVLPG